ncbi:MAG: NUDIX domain-containing protein [Candidatus Nomurabacteria bacterium]|nr:NUDIX domain-containing protein [Candidatus Nomurabacteria bacterium]
MRQVVNYIPVQINPEIKVFIQRRTIEAPTRPGLFGLFGGGIEEGEDKITALLRETYEELIYIPNQEKLQYLGNYFDEENTQKDIYYEIVDTSFESKIEVFEGEYGAFLNKEEVTNSPDISPSEKKALLDLFDKVKE